MHDRADRIPTGGVVVSIAASVAVLVGLRSAVAFEWPGIPALFQLTAIPREGLGIAWSARALWPADLQAVALDRMAGVLVGMALAAVVVATLNALILLAEASAARRNELAVRSAVGATPSEIARMLLSELRTVLMASAALGLVLGFALGGVARVTWTGPFARLGSFDTLSDLALVMSAMLGAVVFAHLFGGWRAAQGPAAAAALRAGTRQSADPIAVFVRRVLPAIHLALSGAVAVAALTLSGSLSVAGLPDTDQEETMVLDGTAPQSGAWSDLLAAIAEVPGLAAESLSAPGALFGLGVRDYATAECGPCIRGLMVAPLWGVIADHYAVGPSFFAMAGIGLREGRVFDERDAAGGEPVAIVNREFARTAFFEGRPLGKKIKLGSDFDEWYTVVGVVEDARYAVPGADDVPRSAAYVSATQHEPRSGSLLLHGTDAAIAAVADVMTAAGFAPSEPVTLSEYRGAAARALRWMWGVVVALAGLALMLAVFGVHTTALQVTRRRTPELAVRRALGATNSRIVAHVLGERLRVALWGSFGMAFFGTMGVAFLRKAAGMSPLGVGPYVLIALGLVSVSLVASWSAAREALGVEPAVVLE